MHIPQAIAYSLLAGLSPIYGLYTSLFPVITYAIFGTSRQLSMGTIAITSLMLANTILDFENKYIPPIDFDPMNSKNSQPNQYISNNREKAKLLIAMANMFWVGAIQIAMSIFQLSFITSYLSEPMINGFLVGSAIHIATSQVKLLFGIELTTYPGAFKIIYV